MMRPAAAARQCACSSGRRQVHEGLSPATDSGANPMLAIFDVILAALWLYWWIIIAAAVMSWLIAFNVVDTRNRFVYMVADTLNRLTEPALRPIRQFMPNLGGIDISPVILLLIIYFIQQLIIRTFYF
jgi:YggT family protein